ncbi:UNVERIFIED_CONTAM: hypothetical protein Slati_1805900 [Sesamum latifolium]|uniref:Retrotransposon gag domain-containing protein n=1 Tax=Sesamum latifolium TaxID=2727402 RepID=A0AAW2WZ73_9LAMI
MVDGTRLVELCKDVDALKDQVRLSSERSEKNIEEIRTMIAALTVHHSINAASSVMEGTGDSQNSQLQRALHWHQVYMKSRLTTEIPNWDEYVRALYNRFDTQLYDDPMAELMNLKQVGTVQNYLDKFDELLNHVYLSEAYAVSCLLAGLRSDIAVQVRMFRPKNLHEAICLAKLQEQAIYLANKRTSHFGRKQLYIMEVLEDEEEELVAEGSDEGKPDCILDDGDVDAAHDYHVSMHAMTALHDYRTMRVTGDVRDKHVHILIDTGSTHKFLDLETAKRLGCKLNSTEPFPVAVANGNKMYSSFACKNFRWKMQGVPYMMIPLGGCDVVVGVQCSNRYGACGSHPTRVNLHAIHATPNQACILVLMATPTRADNSKEEPKALPPRRAHDHGITLKPGTSPINVRPYRYPMLQKNEIERMIQTMLESGIIFDIALAPIPHRRF